MFLQKNITISSVEDKGIQLKIKDEQGKTYSFFKTKKDGSQTQAFEQFKYYKVGDRTGISYKEVPFTGKDGQNVTMKNIMGFMPILPETNEQPARPMATPQKDFVSMPEEYPTDTPTPTQDSFGRRLALHGMVNARLQTHTIQQVKAEIDELLALEDFINTKL